MTAFQSWMLNLHALLASRLVELYDRLECRHSESMISSQSAHLYLLVLQVRHALANLLLRLSLKQIRDVQASRIVLVAVGKKARLAVVLDGSHTVTVVVDSRAWVSLRDFRMLSVGVHEVHMATVQADTHTADHSQVYYTSRPYRPGLLWPQESFLGLRFAVLQRLNARCSVRGCRVVHEDSPGYRALYDDRTVAAVTS